MTKVQAPSSISVPSCRSLTVRLFPLHAHTRSPVRTKISLEITMRTTVVSGLLPSRTTSLAAVAAIAAGVSALDSTARADGALGDVWISSVGGTLVTGGFDHSTGTVINPSRRVFAADFGIDPAFPFSTDEPGFTSDLIGSTMTVNLLQGLGRWNGADSTRRLRRSSQATADKTRRAPRADHSASSSPPDSTFTPSSRSSTRSTGSTSRPSRRARPDTATARPSTCCSTSARAKPTTTPRSSGPRRTSFRRQARLA